MSNKIQFSERWDKLKPHKFKEGELFSTFRAYTAKKDMYYETQINKVFYVMLNDTTMGKAKLITKIYKWSNELTIDEIRKDTYDYWMREDFEKFLQDLYGTPKVFGIWLVFIIEKVGVFEKTLDKFLGEEKN
jgi:hypothetical protein